MDLSRKLEACEQKRRRLQGELSELERCWKPWSVVFERREIEAFEIQRSLQDCLEDKRAVDEQYAQLSAIITATPPRMRFLQKLNKDMENEINTVAAVIESLRRNNENKKIDLIIAEDKVKGLSETKKNLLMQLSGQKDRQGAEMRASTSASAEGN